jgi:hypothetical protein
MTNPNLNLTNQELITELKKRIQTGTLRTEIVAEQVETQTTSLLSALNTKTLLLLVGLTVGFTLLVCYSVTITANSVTGGTIEFQDPPTNQQIEIDLKN